MSFIWWFVKTIVSVAAGAVAVLLLMLFANDRAEYALLGFASSFLFLSVLPWVKLTVRGRQLGLVGIVFAFGLFLVASRPFTQSASHPLRCAGRRVSWCEIENLLFTLGGAPLAALPFALLGLCTLWLSLRTVLRHRRTFERR